MRQGLYPFLYPWGKGGASRQNDEECVRVATDGGIAFRARTTTWRAASSPLLSPAINAGVVRYFPKSSSTVISLLLLNSGDNCGSGPVSGPVWYGIVRH